MKLCVYGGQYGSEGKGSAAEWLLKNIPHEVEGLVAVGENGPNSGHTCSRGKTQNIPASSYFASDVLLGPDSAVHLRTLQKDLDAIHDKNGNTPNVYIHANAAVVCDGDMEQEKIAGIVKRISSTGSGSGAARVLNKAFRRLPDVTVASRSFVDWSYRVRILDHHSYLTLLRSFADRDMVLECSQGALLDLNWGIYPYVTSRPTLPRVVIERNAFSYGISWQLAGVYRTYPIRTGGPSGPTGGKEIKFSDIGVPDEIATVTKRVRRIFQFSRSDFALSIDLTRPTYVCFTHLDYIKADPAKLGEFEAWYRAEVGRIGYQVEGLFLSNTTGQFINHGGFVL